LAFLLKYDSTYGQFNAEIGYDTDHITVDGHQIKVFAEKDPANIPWKDLALKWLSNPQDCSLRQRKLEFTLMQVEPKK